MMRFIEWPWAALLIIILPLLATLIFAVERRSRARRLAKLGTRSMLVRLAPLGERLGPGRTARIAGALILCGAAFAGPRWGVDTQVEHSNGVDVVLALDASLSMMARDAKPSRLEEMKNVVRQLRAQSPNDRFAIVAFAGHSYVLSPLTKDQGALDMYLTTLDPSVVGVAGTSIADAVRGSTALLSVRRGDAGRAIVLMSDGESFDPIAEATEQAKHAGEAGIRLITVGFGTKQGTTIPVRDTNGVPTEKKDALGKIVVTHYDPSTLSQVAQAAAHGLFVPADAPNKAEQIQRVLNSITPSVRATQAGVDLAPRFQWFVLGALLLLMLDTILVLRPRQRRQLTLVTAAAATTLAAACGRSQPQQRAGAATSRPQDTAHVQDTVHIKLYNRGTKLLGRDSMTAALAILDSALQSGDTAVGFRSEFNSGWGYLVRSRRVAAALNGEGQKADAVLEAIVRDTALRRVLLEEKFEIDTADDSTQHIPKALLTGHLSSTWKRELAVTYVNMQMDSAVEKYKAALKLHPDDRDAKWNYELAYDLLPPGEEGRRLPEVAGGNQAKKRTLRRAGKVTRGKRRPIQKGPGSKDKQPKEKPKTEAGHGTRQTSGGASPPSTVPPIEQLRLPQQQALQLLDAVGQRELKPTTKTIQVPNAIPPNGKDW